MNATGYAAAGLAVLLLLPILAVRAFAIGARRKRRASPPHGAGAVTTPAPGPGAAPPPAARQPRGAPPLPPAPALLPHEAAALDALYRARVAVPPRGAHAAQIIADGLRERFPEVGDTTLGLVALDLHGYAVALATGLPDPRAALLAIVDAFGLAAEDLTRFGRLEEVHLDQH